MMKPQNNLSDRFVAHCNDLGLVEGRHRILLAVSGGIDSMTMVELFRRSGFSFGIAHCNFQLRATESEMDQQLVTQKACELGVAFHNKSFDTTAWAKNHKLSIQMAARELRYDWLEHIRSSEGFDYIATAHHLDDAIETLLLNLTRGTGIAGLKGIPAKTGNIIRPLCFASRNDIEAFSKMADVDYREDKSNEDEKYLRNRLRKQVIPVLQNINPGLSKTMQNFFQHIQATEKLYKTGIAIAKKACIIDRKNEIHVKIPELLSFDNPELLIYEFLKEYGFSPSVCKEISDNINRQPGRTFLSKTHVLCTDRQRLLVYPIRHEKTESTKTINKQSRTIHFHKYIFHIEHTECKAGERPQWPETPYEALFDMDCLEFPISVRTWRKGDKMTPLGMSGTKKISDLFVEHKIPRHKKEEIPVFVSGNKIVWLVGIRSSKHCMVSKNTTRIMKISCQNR